MATEDFKNTNGDAALANEAEAGVKFIVAGRSLEGKILKALDNGDLDLGLIEADGLLGDRILEAAVDRDIITELGRIILSAFFKAQRELYPFLKGWEQEHDAELTAVGKLGKLPAQHPAGLPDFETELESGARDRHRPQAKACSLKGSGPA